MDIMNIKRILGKFFYPQGEVGGDRRQLTKAQKVHRKARNKMARESRRRNR